ncbi:lipid kinase [Alsobacter sp. SYSU M60028]|uniref:Lipid kinase n=1 Tax=Alsobacter ponti TaxID=2962936 RepID=A0ABT1LCX0_9HYPH|nr:lipid kinase [Alsobacter ponti]MCP8938923.1 lipid kinase [Alsobacter ponti]
MRAMLIVNQDSRSGSAPLDAATARLEAAGVEIVRHWNGSPGGIPAYVEEHRHAVDAVIAGGGDGTVSAVAGAMVGTGLTLGVLPLGTGNDFARTLGIPTDLPAAAEIIASGNVRSVDVGDVNGVVFLNVASVGISAALASDIAAETKRRFGPFGYVLGSLRVLFKARPFRATITGASGAAEVETLQIAIGNGRHYGGGLTIAPDARIDDGRLDLYSLETRRLWRLAVIAPALRSGEHRHAPDVRALHGAWFEIHTAHPKRINVDGELRAMTPARFVVRPGALRVFAPDEAPGLGAI